MSNTQARRWKRWSTLAFVLLLIGIGSLLTYWYWPRPRLNLLIITLDTTRADRLGCYGYKNGSTPNLDALAGEGVLFEQAYATAPLTLPSHATMFTGLQPAEHGLRTNGKGRLGDSVPTLAEILERQGYETGAFVGSLVLDAKYGLERGFTTYDDNLAGEVPHQLHQHHQERDGQIVVDGALAWLKRVDNRPFCCWVHLYDAHFPYQAHDDRFGPRFLEEPYDGEIAYLDFQVGRLLDYLKSAALERNTLVVVVADHGEGLGEHQERRHGILLYNSTMRVPLIMRSPGRIAASRRVTTRVSLVDLFPTILECLRTPHRAQISGRSLRPALAGKEIPPSICYGATDQPLLEMGWSPLRSLIDGKWKYIRTTRPELYDLSDDFGELNDLAGSQPEQLQRMEQLLMDFESRMIAHQTAQVSLPSRERKALESLGYAATATQATPDAAASEPLPDMKDMFDYWNAFDDAIQLRETGQLDAAIEKLKFAIQGAPTATRPQVYLGSVYDAQGNVAEAEAAYRTALKLDPEFSDAHHYLGDLALRQGKIDEAAAEYFAALESDPTLAEAHFKLGNILQEKGHLDAAQAHFEAAVQHDPNYPPAHINLGNLLVWQGRNFEAEQQYRAALKMSPDSVEARINLAAILAGAGKLREAEAELLQAQRLQPDHALLQERLQRVRAELSRSPM